MLEVMGERFQELACLEAAEAIEAALGVPTPVDPVLEAALAR
jgi:amidase